MRLKPACAAALRLAMTKAAEEAFVNPVTVEVALRVIGERLEADPRWQRGADGDAAFAVPFLKECVRVSRNL